MCPRLFKRHLATSNRDGVGETNQGGGKVVEMHLFLILSL